MSTLWHIQVKKQAGRKAIVIALAAGLAVWCMGSSASAEYLMNSPDGRMLQLKEGTFQPDLSPYMSKLPEVKILDRRFFPKHQQWGANEEFLFSQEGLSNMVRAAMPLAHNAAFIWLTNQQLYWSARNMLGFGFAASHAGINMVNGPYWTMKALELSKFTRLQRDRGERLMSNKDVMLQYYFPLYWKMIGLPRFPDDGQPAYLEFLSGDPHFIAPTPVSDTFDDPQYGKNGKWGVPEYFFNNRQWRWDRDGMDKILDMGGLGIMLKRASMWVDYMWKSTHSGISPSTQNAKVKIPLKGNDSEEGFRGMALATTRINQAMALKTELVADLEGNLGGINPKTYDPSQGFRYFPHQIRPNMLLAGDLPERQWNFDILDPRSFLFDQGALLWGATHIYQSTFRMTEMFTENPPIDGGLMEKELGVVPHYLANMLLKNIMAMHTINGLLVSEWGPKQTKWYISNPGKSGKSHTVNMTDMTVTFLGLKEYIDRMRDPRSHVDNPNIKDTEPQLTKKAEQLMTRNADFLLKVQGKDGSFCESYDVVAAAPSGPCDLSRPNFNAIGALLEIYQLNGEMKYAEAARKNWNYLWKNYWHEPTGLFRSRLGDDTVRFHALDGAAQLRAWREILFTTPVHLVRPLIDKFNRYTVQTFMLSGMIQSEENRSGELSLGVGSRDWDNDGIPWLGKGDGTFGIAPVWAHEIAINIGEPGKNETFNKLDGEKHWAEKFGGDVRYHYQPMPQAQAVQAMLLPVKLNIPMEDGHPVTEYDDDENVIGGWVERGTMLRWDGTKIKMPPSRPFKRGSDLKGKQIFEMNCAHCHGYAGEGITGIPFDSDSLARTRDDMFEVPHNGRFTRLMPEWGLGLQDEMESTLTDEEIYRIVDYIQSPEFQQMFIETENGIHYPSQPPRDAYFYISRSYVRGKRTAATEEDIALVMNAQMEAIKTGKKVNIIQRLIEAEQKRKPNVVNLPFLGPLVAWFAGDESAQKEIQQVRNWNPEDYKLVLGYTNEEQVYYAQKPLEFLDVLYAREHQNKGDNPTVEEAAKKPNPPIVVHPVSDGLETPEIKVPDDQQTFLQGSQKGIRVAQSFDQDQYSKVLPYNMEKDVTARGGRWPYGLNPDDTEKLVKAQLAKRIQLEKEKAAAAPAVSAKDEPQGEEASEEPASTGPGFDLGF